MASTPISFPSASERAGILAVQTLRRQKLERLYERRALVDELIASLEQYQKAQQEDARSCRRLTA